MYLILFKVNNLVKDVTGINIPFLEAIASKGGMCVFINFHFLSFHLCFVASSKEKAFALI